jgi:hypothetical protein
VNAALCRGKPNFAGRVVDHEALELVGVRFELRHAEHSLCRIGMFVKSRT